MLAGAPDGLMSVCVFVCMHLCMCEYLYVCMLSTCVCVYMSMCVGIKARAVSWAEEPSESLCSMVLRHGMRVTAE